MRDSRSFRHLRYCQPGRKNKFLAKTLDHPKVMLRRIDLCRCLKKHQRPLPILYAIMGRGRRVWATGHYSEQIAAYIEKSMKLKKKVKARWFHPLVVSSIAVICIARLIMIFRLSLHLPMFTQMGELSLATLFVMKLSAFLAGHGRPVDRIGNSRFYYSVQTNQENRKKAR